MTEDASQLGPVKALTDWQGLAMGIVRIGLVRFGPAYKEIGPGYSMYQYQYQPKHEYRRQYSVPAQVSSMYMHM